MYTVDRQSHGIPGKGSNLFVYDDSSTSRQVNRLINTHYRDKHSVDAEVGYQHTSIASRWSTLKTRALGTCRHKVAGKDVATDRQIQIFDLGLRPALVKGTLSYCFEKPGCERAIQNITRHQ